METILQVKQIEKIYGNKGSITRAIEDISFQVAKGEFVGIMGPSGSGKTTLLNCISTIDNVTSGHILIGKEDITKMKSGQLSKFRREQLGFIFQDYNLLDNMTLMDNIALPLSLSNEKAKNIQQRVQEMAGLFHLEGHLKKYPHQLSGGQKQRGAAARALIRNPRIVFADEPTGALDSKSSRELLCSLKEINEERNATILMVTHDAFSASYARKVFILKDGEIFTTLHADAERSVFYERILQLLASMGGD